MEVCSLTFSKCLHLCSHCLSSDIYNFTLESSLMAPFSPFTNYSSCFCHYRLVLPGFSFTWNRVVFTLLKFPALSQCDAFEVRSHCSFLLLSSIPMKQYTTILSANIGHFEFFAVLGYYE